MSRVSVSVQIDWILKKRTKKQKTEIKKLTSMPDEVIDTSDIPETTDWSNAVVGIYYKPVKKTGDLTP